MKKNKSPGAYGITAEHVQLTQENLLPLITAFINSIQHGTLPQHLKEGVLTSVLKMEKDQRIPSNYRGITVTTTTTATYNSVHQYNHRNWEPPTTNEGRSTYSGI